METRHHRPQARTAHATARALWFATWALAALGVLCASSAHAQDEGEQRQAAAEAYDRGTSAYLRSDYARAARWFETAHRLAPAAPALIQAVRAHHKADDVPRALTLSLRLKSEYADDPRAVALADELLSAHASNLVKVSVGCDQECQIDLDGKLQEAQVFFLEPDTAHEVTAIFPTGDRTEQVTGSGGDQLELAFAAPPAPVEPIAALDAQTSTPVDASEDGSLRGLSPIYVYVGAGVTTALLVGMVVSGLDANAKGDRLDRTLDDFDDAGCRDETPPDLDECTTLSARAESQFGPADSAETRTNVLIALTLAAAAGTGVVAAFFTDWHQDRKVARPAPLRFGVASMGDGAFATMGGAF